MEMHVLIPLFLLSIHCQVTIADVMFKYSTTGKCVTTSSLCFPDFGWCFWSDVKCMFNIYISCSCNDVIAIQRQQQSIICNDDPCYTNATQAFSDISNKCNNRTSCSLPVNVTISTKTKDLHVQISISYSCQRERYAVRGCDNVHVTGSSTQTTTLVTSIGTRTSGVYMVVITTLVCVIAILIVVLIVMAFSCKKQKMCWKNSYRKQEVGNNVGDDARARKTETVHESHSETGLSDAGRSNYCEINIGSSAVCNEDNTIEIVTEKNRPDPLYNHLHEFTKNVDIISHSAYDHIASPQQNNPSVMQPSNEYSHAISVSKNKAEAAAYETIKQETSTAPTSTISPESSYNSLKQGDVPSNDRGLRDCQYDHTVSFQRLLETETELPTCGEVFYTPGSKDTKPDAFKSSNENDIVSGLKYKADTNEDVDIDITLNATDNHVYFKNTTHDVTDGGNAYDDVTEAKYSNSSSDLKDGKRTDIEDSDNDDRDSDEPHTYFKFEKVDPNSDTESANGVEQTLPHRHNSGDDFDNPDNELSVENELDNTHAYFILEKVFRDDKTSPLAKSPVDEETEIKQ